jgi:hypothetical protein
MIRDVHPTIRIPDPGAKKDPEPGSVSTTLPLRITPRTSCINLIKTFKYKCLPEGEVDPLLLAGWILGNAVEPVLLHRSLHQQQRAGEQRETDEVRSSLNIKIKIRTVCMRLAANLALFACGWRPIWRYLHAAGGQSGVIFMRLAAI